MGEGAELPVPQVRGGEQNSLAATLRLLEMFVAFIADPTLDVAAIDFGKSREGHQQPGDRAEYAIYDFTSLERFQVRQRHLEIPKSHAPQPGHC